MDKCETEPSCDVESTRESKEAGFAPELLKDLKHYRFGPIWDGNVNSKYLRDKLHALDLIDRAHGFQFITDKGVTVLHHMGLLNESTWRERRKNS